MKQICLTKFRSSVFMCLIVFLGSVAHADVRQLVFDPPREANLRQKNGTLGRGLLVSIDSIRVRLRLANGEDLDVPLDVIQFLRTVDTEFMYTSKDDIQAVITKGAELEKTILTSGAGESPSTEPVPASNGGFGTASNSDTGAVKNGGFGTAQPATTMNNGGFGSAQPANGGDLEAPAVIVICDNCKKEVQASAEYGQKCPHCGIEWSLDIPQSAFTQSNSKTDQLANAGQAQNGNHGRPANPMNKAVPQAAPPAGLPPATQPQAQEFNMANLPIWMKAGLFFLFAGGGYYMFFYRA